MKCKSVYCDNETFCSVPIFCGTCRVKIGSGQGVKCKHGWGPEIRCQNCLSENSMKCKTSNCGNTTDFQQPFCLSCSNPTPAPSARTYSSEHYKGKGMEAIDVIEAFNLGRNLANVVKYVLRADHKGQRDSDLEKAINYLWRERYGTWRP